MEFIVENNGLRVNGYGPLHGLSYSQLTRLEWAIERRFTKFTSNRKGTDVVLVDYSDQLNLYTSFTIYLGERLLPLQGKPQNEILQWIKQQPDLSFLLEYAKFKHFHNEKNKPTYDDILRIIITELRSRMAEQSVVIQMRIAKDDENIYTNELNVHPNDQDPHIDFIHYQLLESFTG